MGRSEQNFNLEVQGMKAVCPLGEVVGDDEQMLSRPG